MPFISDFGLCQWLEFNSDAFDRYMDYLDEDNEVGNPGALPDPTYSPPGSSVAPEAAAGEPYP